jgi:hypothetical protein
VEDRGQPQAAPEQAPGQVPAAELERRAEIMFSGLTGAVVASGAGGAACAPTLALVDDVIKTIGKLPGALFDKNVKERRCGLLDRRGAYGMLICDVLGLPLIPWVLAEPIGKEAAKLQGNIAAEIKTAKKAAARKGLDAQAAAAGVRRRAVKLPLPTAAEIKKVRRQIEKAAAPPPPPPPPPPPRKHRVSRHCPRACRCLVSARCVRRAS